MSVIVINDNNSSDILCFKNEDKYNITTSIINKLSELKEKKKILYFNYSFDEDELLKKYKLLNNKDVIIINKPSNTVDDIEKYITYSKPTYVCVDYFKMVDKKCCYQINNKSLKYVLDKIDEYSIGTNDPKND